MLVNRLAGKRAPNAGARVGGDEHSNGITYLRGPQVDAASALVLGTVRISPSSIVRVRALGAGRMPVMLIARFNGDQSM